MSFSNLKSRLVTIPINLPEFETIGIPPILYFFILFFASITRESFVRVTGSIIIPDSALFTNLTSLDWSSIDRFLCITPIPPSLAIAIAILLSVTVSIAAETIGIFRSIFLLNFVFKETSEGRTSEYAGTSSTSSYVSPSPTNFDLDISN